MTARRGLVSLLLVVGVLVGVLAACGGDGDPHRAVETSPTGGGEATVAPVRHEEVTDAEPGSPWPGRLALGGGALLVGLLAGLGGGHAIARRNRPRGDPAPPAAAAGPASGAVPATALPARRPVPRDPDRALVDGLLAVADLADGPAVRAQVRTTLHHVGIVELPTATGETFDVTLHNAVGSEPAPEPGLHMTIARVVRRGWETSSAVIRPSDVEVFRHQEDSA